MVFLIASTCDRSGQQEQTPTGRRFWEDLADAAGPTDRGCGLGAAASGFFGDGEGFGLGDCAGRIRNKQNDFSFSVWAHSERGNGFSAWRFRYQPKLQNAIAGWRCDFLPC